MSAVSNRAGYSLVEALVALVVAGVLTVCLAAVLALVGRVAIRHAEAAAAAETERTVAAVLGAELRASTAGDVVAGADSIRMRVFRGRGLLCDVEGSALALAYTGVRMPEEDKDSVLLLWPDRERAYDVTGVGASECGGHSVRVETTWPALDSIDAPLIALVFETGAYSIGSAAFRYRRGSAGRQPLTEENLSTAASGLSIVPRDRGSGAARVTLRSTESRRAPASSWLIGMLQGSIQP